jgi:hypothetical protein
MQEGLINELLNPRNLDITIPFLIGVACCLTIMGICIKMHFYLQAELKSLREYRRRCGDDV